MVAMGLVAVVLLEEGVRVDLVVTGMVVVVTVAVLQAVV
jgi:hypothetical protein